MLKFVMNSLCILILFVLTFIAGYYIGAGYYFEQDNPQSESVLLKECANITTEETATCLKNQLKEFYFYNISNIDKALSLNNLKKEGGVCRHYATWFCSQARNLGFFCREVSIDTEQGGHRFAVISGINDYCIVDQIVEPKCNFLALVNKTINKTAKENG